MKYDYSMLRLKRTQLIIQTKEGEVLTSVELEFEGIVNEYIPVATFRFVMGLKEDQIDQFIAEFKLITKERHGQLWLNCSDLMPLFGWTPS